MGSSPRMRGAPFHARGVVEELGLIPAHAGSTAGAEHLGYLGGAHPRACGEHLGV